MSSNILITLIDPNVKYPLRLANKEILSHDTIKFRFQLPSEDHILGISVGQHIFLSYQEDGQLIVRPYTPVTNDSVKGYMDLVIKIYRRNVNPKFPEGGKMTQHLESMEIGDFIDVSGLSGLLIYEGRGRFAIRPDETSEANKFNVKKVNMIAGGAGITPMLQLIRAVFSDKEDNLKLSLIFANQTEQDIILRDELEDCRDRSHGRLSVWYTLDRAPSDWSYSTGFINEDMIRNHLMPPADDTLTIMCGPPPMINSTCIPNLDKLGYTADRRFSY